MVSCILASRLCDPDGDRTMAGLTMISIVRQCVTNTSNNQQHSHSHSPHTFTLKQTIREDLRKLNRMKMYRPCSVQMYHFEHPRRYIFSLTLANPKRYLPLRQHARFSGFGLGKMQLSRVQVRLRLGQGRYRLDYLGQISLKNIA